MNISPEQLAAACGCRLSAARRWLGPLVQAMARYGIDTPARQADFLAQVGHESGSLAHVEEIASGADYEGRKDLGNTRPGDGKRFKGRGLIQITGRANYAAAGSALGIDLLANPERLEEPEFAALSAAWFWRSKGLNELSDLGEFDQITRRINGGTNGAADRRERRKRARAALGLDPSPALRRGDSGPEVLALQKALAARGVRVGADGVFGPATESALRGFQASHGLVADGIAGPQTMRALGL
ncbi:Predicted chitinase [Methylomagnum ishizawai]|uniref:Predicted chitinase n=1 Tax=Methylomagnum ishizawai TaxID=1760988 RepID=A0A1Y6CUD8_9GAMM|nr:peptidoglycan-binding protein [Methylomagnum ishizawai]SMF93917.1 Predicted chitinase [Methylomagnum ishizawai]